MGKKFGIGYYPEPVKLTPIVVFHSFVSSECEEIGALFKTTIPNSLISPYHCTAHFNIGFQIAFSAISNEESIHTLRKSKNLHCY